MLEIKEKNLPCSHSSPIFIFVKALSSLNHLDLEDLPRREEKSIKKFCFERNEAKLL